MQLVQSTYDPCLLYRKSNSNDICILGMQTDDEIFGANKVFTIKEQKKLTKAGFIAKEREMVTTQTPFKFNDGKIHLEKDNSIILTQTQYCENLIPIFPEPVNSSSPRNEIRKSLTPREQYFTQRARGEYIASLCQPQASFDLSSAAKIVNPNEADIK